MLLSQNAYKLVLQERKESAVEALKALKEKVERLDRKSPNLDDWSEGKHSAYLDVLEAITSQINELHHD